MSAQDTPDQAALRAYLEKHNVQPRLNELLNGLVYNELPADPFAWMAAELTPGGSAPSPSSWPSPADAAADAGFARLSTDWGLVLGMQVAPGAPSAAPTPSAAPAAAATSAPAPAPATATAAELSLIHI